MVDIVVNFLWFFLFKMFVVIIGLIFGIIYNLVCIFVYEGYFSFEFDGFVFGMWFFVF